MPPAATKPCGTTAGYHRHRNRGEDACDACLAAWNARTREESRWRRSILFPERQLVDAAPVRDACLDAIDAGASRLSIAREAGVPYSTVAAIVSGRSSRTQRRNAEAIVAACREERRDGEPQPVEIAAGLLRVVFDHGATWQWVADELQTSPSQVDRVLNEKQRTVQAATLDRIERLTAAVLSGEKRPPRMREAHRRRVECERDECIRPRRPGGRVCHPCAKGLAPERAAA